MSYGAEDAVVVQVNIASGSQLTTEAIDARYYKLAAIEFPSAFTGANVAIHGSATKDGTYHPIYDDGNSAVTVTKPGVLPAIAGVDSNSGAIAAVRFLKLKSASSEGADRALKVHLKS